MRRVLPINERMLYIAVLATSLSIRLSYIPVPATMPTPTATIPRIISQTINPRTSQCYGVAE